MKNKKTVESINKIKEVSGVKSTYELAKKIDFLADSSLRRYLKGSVSITVDKLEEIALTLGYDLIIDFKKNKK